MSIIYFLYMQKTRTTVQEEFLLSENENMDLKDAW